jgi:hypothetical protein
VVVGVTRFSALLSAAMVTATTCGHFGDFRSGSGRCADRARRIRVQPIILLKKRISLVVTLNRVTRVLKPTRVRFHSAVAGAAFAIIAGLSAPAAAASIGTHATDTPATTNVAAVTQASPAKATAAVKAAAAPAAPAPAGSSAPSAKDLHPMPVTADQQTLNPSADQIRNARAIMQTGQNMHLPARAWVIAIATSMQESQLTNIGDLGSANDHDSLGLFQQRPSSGWGTPDQIQNPTYAATSFYKGLTGVHDWKNMPLTDAAQAVQVSAVPDGYAKWEKVAGDLVDSFYGAGPYAAATATVK